MFVLPAPTAPAVAAASSTPSRSGSAPAVASGEASPDGEAFLMVLADALSAWVEDLSQDADEPGSDDSSPDDADEAMTVEAPDTVAVARYVPLVGANPEPVAPTGELAGDAELDDAELGDAELDGDVAVAVGGFSARDTAGEPADIEAAPAAEGVSPERAAEGAPDLAEAVATTGPDTSAAGPTVDPEETGVIPAGTEGDEAAPRIDARRDTTSEPSSSRPVVDETAPVATVARHGGIESGPIGPTPDTDGPASVQPTTLADALAEAEADALEADDPWMQVARALRPLHQMADGSHRIALQLRPAELGAVHLEVTLDDGRLSVRALVESAATREVLAAALPDLRDELTTAGIDLDSVDLGDRRTDSDGSSPGHQPDQAGRSGRLAVVDGDAAAPGSTTADPAPTTVASGRLDLSL